MSQEKKRKIKQIYKRRQLYEVLHPSDICKEISEETGFTVKDINEVVSLFIEIIVQKLLLKKCINLIGLGRLNPSLRPPRVVNTFKNRKMTGSKKVDAQWGVQFQLATSAKAKVKDMIATQEDINNLYED